MSLRRLWVLVSKLPQDSCTSRVLHGEAADWTTDTYLARAAANAAIQANYQRAGKRPPDSALIAAPKDKAGKKPSRLIAAKAHQKVGGAAELDALFIARQPPAQPPGRGLIVAPSKG